MGMGSKLIYKSVPFEYSSSREGLGLELATNKISATRLVALALLWALAVKWHGTGMGGRRAWRWDYSCF